MWQYLISVGGFLSFFWPFLKEYFFDHDNEWNITHQNFNPKKVIRMVLFSFALVWAVGASILLYYSSSVGSSTSKINDQIAKEDKLIKEELFKCQEELKLTLREKKMLQDICRPVNTPNFKVP